MAEQPPPSASATDSSDVVRIRKSHYLQAVAQMKQQKLQLTAASNLHRLMRDKEKELIASKDRNEQLQLALQQSEARLSNMMRLQAATAMTVISESSETHGLEADGASTEVGLPRYEDVEEDGVALSQPAHCSESSISELKPTEKSRSKTVTLDSVAVTEIPITSVPYPPGSTLSADGSLTSTCPTVVTLPATSSVSSVTSAASFQSRDLLDKVLQQNARLKKTLRDFLSHKGLSVSTYLDRQEYEDAAEILRHDLADAHKHISQLKSVIASRNNGDIDRVTQECARLADRVAVLERKLSISQAYSDALRQAHDKCRQEGSHVETNSESSAKYAQVLEELEKLKVHCKDCEVKNTALQTELEMLRQQLIKANEESLSELDRLKSENQQLVEEQQLNNAQIATYAEDFKIEQKEKQEQQKKYEINIAKHQEWVRRLAVEAQKCRTSWQEESVKREELENKLKSIQSKHLVPSERMTCGSAMSAEVLLSLPVVDVGVDGPPDTGVDSDLGSQRTGTLRCPRCEREFPYAEKPRWELHCRRCTDD